MSATPTTWRSTPACATEEMIEAGRMALRYAHPSISNPEACEAARLMWIKMSEASPKPKPVSPWLAIGPDAKTGDDVLLGCTETGICSVSGWDEDVDGWRTTDNCIWPAGAFDVYRALDPLPPATGDADHG